MDVGHILLLVSLVVSIVCFYLDHQSQKRTIDKNAESFCNKNSQYFDEIRKLKETLKDKDSEILTLKETEAVNLKELHAVVEFNKELKDSLAMSQLEFTRLAESSRRSGERVNGVLNPS